jgi:hypothetical protein
MKTTTKFDSVSFLTRYENRELFEADIIQGFQELINSGLVWKLQGSYGRTAARLIEGGYCHE